MKSPKSGILPWAVVFFAGIAGALAACGDVEEQSTTTGGGTNVIPSGEGLPCDVSQVLADRCWSCHGATPAGGAPMSLSGYDQMTAASKGDPSKSNAELSVVRMQAMNMPPGGGATAAEIAVLQDWITAGSPKGTCGVVTDPFGGPIVCTSGKTWTFGEDVSDAMRPQMHPGGACITCHANEPPPDTPPVFFLAGTVYPTGHEPDECYGIDGTAMSDVKVHVEDSAGNVYDLPVEPTGNFLLSPDQGLPFVPPYSAKVVSANGERVMGAKQMSGDCNACHTAAGNGAGSMAPGRIVAP